MYTVHDYTHLDPATARSRYIALANRVHAEQFHCQFFIRDPRPEQYLKYEISAWYEGRIPELHGWTDPFGQALRYVYDALKGWIEWFWNYSIRPGISAIVSGFRWLWDRAADLASAARDAAVSAASAISSVWSWIQQGASWVYQQITNVVLPYIRQHYLLLLGPVGVILDNVKGLFPHLNTIWNSITTAVSGVFETISQQVAALPQAIASAFQSAISYIRDVLKGVWDDLIVPIGNSVKGGLEWIAGQVRILANTAWNALQNVLRSFAPVVPEKAEQMGMLALTVTGTAAGGLIGMTAIWDILHPFKDVIPGELKAMIYDVTNFKLILGGLAGALVTASIAQPAKYLYNSIFQPYIPREDDLRRFLWRGKITEQEYLMYLQYHGYSDRFRSAYLELTHEIPPPSDLVRFVVREVGLMPKDYETAIVRTAPGGLLPRYHLGAGTQKIH